MISVIIPLYNKEAYINKAVDSVLQQSFKNFELIIINDGSKDNSLKVVQKYQDNRIRIIDQDNAGVSTARNNGVREAKYDYVAFLDADDWWDFAYLSEMWKLIKKYPDAGLWAAKYFKVKRGQKIEANIGFENDDFVDGYINYFKVYAKTMWMPIYPPSVIIRKKVLKSLGGFNSSLKLGEDFDLWVRIALAFQIAYLNKPLVYYNQDVDVDQRAIGSDKIWQPKNHYVFNLGYLLSHERKNKDLKVLLDNLRARALLRYYRKNAYPKEVKKILQQIDQNNIPFFYRFVYNNPPWLLNTLYYYKRLGSIAKRQFKKFLN